ncbi:hypothetical protein BDQ17DRAFT_1371641 [Cyathus striatus]|nr:hypothetical protein BDQ17DRAFT_1371641 [Cyathus striatus]
MSSRLKRKLADLGVDPSSSKANESFCLVYWDSFTASREIKDTGEFVPLWKQEVRDEKGRRRLHGAFTGGFSAGYFNTVGSKEGWTPATFVSSRNERAKKKEARPEDFMDEEDLQELRENQKIVDTTDEMDFMGGTQAELQMREGAVDSGQDSIASTLEASMLPTPQDSAGARILKKMGWRIGQGIGPRISLRQRRLQDIQASQPGTRITLNDIKLNEEDDEANKHTYAPRDTSIIVAGRKDNFHGVGYSPGMGLHESLGVKEGDKASSRQISAGFGLGALNDADEDDLDIYEGDITGSGRNRIAYDTTESGENEKITIGRADEKKSQSKAVTSPSTTFRDGRPVLTGFVLSDEPVSQDIWFPVPDIPKGWKPDPRRVWEKHANKENAQVEPPVYSGPVPLSRRGLMTTADERGSLLGETPLPSAPRSVFEYISEKDKERLKNIATAAASGAPVAAAAAALPRLDPQIAQAALSGFQPFTADPAKQVRYTAYLHSQADPSNAVPKPLDGQRSEDYHKELEDYVKSAQIFKPMSGAMAGRFTSSAVLDLGPKIHEGLHQPTKEEMEQKEEERAKEEESRVSPKVHAARMGMYGPMTRETKLWQPARLLSKRFGLKEPDPPPEPDAGSSTADASSTSNWEDAIGIPVPKASSDTKRNDSADGPRDLSNVGLGEDESQGRDTLTYQRPSMDVFKAIFASDDEDSDDDEQEVVKEPDEPPPPTTAEIPSVAVVIPDNKPIDLGTFKPTFIPREGKSKRKDEKEKGKKKKKEKKSVLVSFEMDEDGTEGLSIKPSKEKERPKKKKRKEKREDEDDETMWVEKPPPETVKDLVVPPSKQNGLTQNMQVDTPSELPTKGRKRAIDFM